MLDRLKVKAYDAENSRFYPAVILKKEGKYVVEKAVAKQDDSQGQASDLYLSPGWIDLHTHINDGFGLFGTNADEIGYRTGVCMVVDAGTVGDYTIAGFRKYVEPTIRTNFKLFLCISPIGVIFHHEYNVLDYLNVENTIRTINDHRDIISGVKVRIGSEVIRHEGIEPLRLASAAARRAGLPLMVHIGGNPPYITDIEPYLEKGDIITHCFNGRGGDAWNPDGTPVKAMQKMIERGVILDVGHGGSSFSFDVCARALRHRLPKFGISTDLHAFSRNRLVYNMATTLTKMLGLSLPLEDIMHGVTKLPAEALRLPDWCNLAELHNATLFRVEHRPEQYEDCEGQVRTFDRKIVPVGVVLNGVFHDLEDR
jgi:dihydroorotase